MYYFLDKPAYLWFVLQNEKPDNGKLWKMLLIMVSASFKWTVDDAAPPVGMNCD
jgi:hypothetical protein